MVLRFPAHKGKTHFPQTNRQQGKGGTVTEQPKGGRPPLDDSRKHNEVVSIRLTKGEIEKLDRYGKIKGLSRSQIIQKWIDMIIC